MAIPKKKNNNCKSIIRTFAKLCSLNNKYFQQSKLTFGTPTPYCPTDTPVSFLTTLKCSGNGKHAKKF